VVVVAIVRYSVSVENLATVGCFRGPKDDIGPHINNIGSNRLANVQDQPSKT